MLAAIRGLLNRDPFVPFRITLTSGESFDVAHPGLVAEGATHVIYCYPRSDRFAILRLNQFASLETLDNGHRPRRR